MNKTIIILAGLFLFLGIGAFYYMYKGVAKSTMEPTGDYYMAVDDLDKIHKIFIADREGQTVKIVRDGKKKWIYNDKHLARPNATNLVLDVIKRVRLKYRPSQGEIKNMIESLASRGIKVEVYNKKDENIRTFYVGGGTADERGTYMILEGSDNPYVMYLPAWEGNLRSRFFFGDDNWRDKTVFQEKQENITRVAVDYPKQRSRSFVVEKKGRDYEVKPLYETTTPFKTPIKQGKVEAFLEEFKKIGAEAFENTNPKRDSICNLMPFSIVSLTNDKGEEKSIQFHPLVNESVGTEKPIERYMAKSSSGDFYLVQQLVFGKIFWAYDSFFNREEEIKG